MEICRQENWHALFNKAEKCTIFANLPFAVPFGQKDFKLDKSQLGAGIMACSKKGQAEIDAIIMAYEVFHDKPHSFNIKNLLINPFNISTKVIAEKYPWTDHIIQPKIDGARRLVLINNSSVTMLGESDFESFDIKTLSTDIQAIIECEQVENVLLAFDAYMHDGHSIRELRYSDRILVLNQIISSLGTNSLDRVVSFG